MAVLPNLEIREADVKDPSLSVLNDHLRRIVTEINRLNGVHGNIAINNSLDMQGQQIVNNNQSEVEIGASYTFSAADQGKFKVFTNQQAVKVSANTQIAKNKFYCRFLFTGAAGGSITPTVPGLINGAASKSFTQGQGGYLYFDSVNWWVS